MALKTVTEQAEGLLTDLLKYELNATYCREKVQVSAAVTRGQPLTRGANGQYRPLDPTAAIEVPHAVALFDALATEHTAVIRRACVLARSALVMATGSEEQQAAVITKLNDAGLVVVEDY